MGHLDQQADRGVDALALLLLVVKQGPWLSEAGTFQITSPPLFSGCQGLALSSGSWIISLLNKK